MPRILSESDREYLELLKAKRRRMLEEDVQSYRVGSRQLQRYQFDLKHINGEIARLEGASAPRVRRAVPVD